MAKLTAAGIDRIKPTSKRQEIPDALLPGLYLAVQPTGRKSWQIRYRAGGVHRRMTLGPYPMLSLADARERGSAAMREVMEGEDPAAKAKAAKAKRQELAERDTIEALLQTYAKRHLSKLKSGDTAKRELERHAGAAWKDRDIHTISKRDVLDLLDGIVDSGRATTANRLRAYLGKFFNWCVERDVIDTSPMIGVKAPAKEVSRDRVMSDDEIRWFWQACEDVGQPWGPIGRLLLLTGQRLGEVSAMTDSEIRGDVWHLSADRTKNGRAHDVPLSKPAQAVVEGMTRIKSRAGYLHTTTGETPVSGFHKARHIIAERMEQIAEDERCEAVEIPKWGFHDLRRTAATGMARLGIPVRVTEAVLNHVSGTGGGIVAVYQRHDYADEKRSALEAWARFVASIVEGEAGNVVRIAK